MKTFVKDITIYTSEQVDVLEITQEAQAILDESKIRDGMLVLHVPGSTASISTIEYESGCVADLKRAIEEIAPRDAEYQHHLRWGDGNGAAHVAAALLGPSRTFPVQGGQIVLGTWQQIILIDLDNKPRHRHVLAQVIGK